MLVLGVRKPSMRMMRMVMKVCMNIIAKTGHWRMRNMVKFIALCHFSMRAMMAMVTMVTMVAMTTMMAMMVVNLSLLDTMLAVCFITGQQKVSYCLFKLHVLFCRMGLNWKARRARWGSKSIPFATTW